MPYRLWRELSIRRLMRVGLLCLLVGGFGFLAPNSYGAQGPVHTAVHAAANGGVDLWTHGSADNAAHRMLQVAHFPKGPAAASGWEAEAIGAHDVEHPDYYENLLIVKFAPEYRVRLDEGEFVDLERRADPGELARLTELGEWARAYALDEATIDTLRRQAEEISGEAKPDLNNYFHFSLPEDWTPETGIERLAASPLLVYVDRIPLPQSPQGPGQAIPNYTDPPPGQWQYQRYLDPAPEGIDARWAWQGSGGKGENVRICNIEYGFNAAHVDLPPITTLGPIFFGNFEEHGTSVMSVMGGRENGSGVTGIVPNAEYFFAYVALNSQLQVAMQAGIHNAILNCMNALSLGDIILIEQQIAGPNRPPDPDPGDQSGLVAVDWDKPIYDVVQIAAPLMLVVQAAGNGGEWLDSPVYQLQSSHNPFQNANSSGSLIVGAGISPFASDSASPATSARAATGFTNHGTIVRMQGWGNGVVAAGTGVLFPGADDEGVIDPAMRNQYYTWFGGTSAASPIVVGAAAALQGMHKEIFGMPLFPAQLIELLIDTGTPQLGANIIGPQPNIRAAAEQMFANNNIFLNAAAPSISPGGGPQTLPQDIEITYGDPSQNQLNTVIRFTLDGTDPTFEHGWSHVPESNSTLQLNFSSTLKAIAYQYNDAAKRWVESEMVVEEYTGGTPVTATPNIVLPHAGTQFMAPLTVTLTSATPGATIRYRTDGTPISIFSPGTLYNEPFVLGPGEYSIVARANKAGYWPSESVYQHNITVVAPQVLPPIVTPYGGSFNGGVEVAMSHSVPEAEIRYTTDGTNVQANSPLYIEPLWLDQSVQLRARAFLAEHDPSTQQILNFDIAGPPRPPTISPDGGNHAGAVTVSINTPAGASSVRYTTNGAEPTASSPVYKGPFTLGVGLHTVKAKAYGSRGLISATASARFRVFSLNTSKVLPPLFNPEGGTYTGAQTVSLHTDTEDAIILYTIDSSPRLLREDWETYDDRPLRLLPRAEPYEVRAVAMKRGMDDSDIVSAEYTILESTGVVETPTMSPATGAFTDTIQVTLELTNAPPFEDALILHTTDGLTPTLDSWIPGVESPHTLTLARPTKVMARGIQRGYESSPVVEAEYFFYCDAPRITAGGSYRESVSVQMMTRTPQATIHYTLDGSEPTQRSPQYTRPIELGEGRHVVRAKCFRNHFEPSRTVQQLYTVQPPPPAPSLRRQPEDKAVPPGAPIVLEAELAGDTPEDARYQWQRNGVNLIGANEPRLEIPAAESGFAGTYRLIVETPGGRTTSREAEISLQDTPIAGLMAENDGATLLGSPSIFLAWVEGGTSVEYAWDFGDGNAGSGSAPRHTYAETGIYTATVTASNSISQATATTTVEVTDTPAPISGLAAVNSSPTEWGEATRFSASTVGGTSVEYAWDFGDGNIAEGRVVSHVYTQTGVYTATVTATNTEGTEQAQTVATVARASRPIEELKAGNSSPTTLGNPTVFNATIEDGTNVSFAWDFGDGNAGSGSSPSHTYAVPGTYMASVVASNDLGQQEAQTVVNVVDGDRPIETVNASATSPTELGEETRFTASSDGSGVTYAWDFGDGNMGRGASVDHVYAEVGSYVATVTAQNENSQNSATVEVLVQVTAEPIEDVDLESPDEARSGRSVTFRATLGAGSNVLYSWDFGDGNTGTGAVVNHTYTQPGEYLMRLTVSNELGETTVERTIVVAEIAAEEVDTTLPDIFLPTLQR